MPSPLLRTFIAIELNTTLTQSIADIQQQFKKANADVKWIEPPNAHITLKFLGDTSLEKISGIQKMIQAVASRISPFTIEFQEIGAFPQLEHPRIIWIGLKEHQNIIKDIAQQLENELASLGFPKERRDFSSHITIGRVRSLRGKAELMERIQEVTVPHLTQEINCLTLFQSTLTPQGAIYKILFQSPLLIKKRQ